ncbi:phytanoyl-CoA dioxygenase family protein [Dyadobacter sp. LHD-138]|uniref:phytanoyl-CoA dioxygenase family protein n=1 Tax=Dyadobacter sp. LHD-138 TaxID=3071413 RepID=UPI0027E06E98|nr:phytanoyl-CoA dioxygenase family protein [Dyadobacter sp. LHD-138]MDQ6477633.1 phytanoyl-CoA dioxygenase family protein [Dyadobacter sp. LHD-138]
MTINFDLADKMTTDGFAVVNNVFENEEIEDLIEEISKADQTKSTFRKSSDLFAIRQFLKEIPTLTDKIFNNNLKHIITNFFGGDFFIVKSIYFDKPGSSNWFVPYHQDLTISVDQKLDTNGYGPWTVKQNQFSVQPPIDILQDIFTIRIHLDDTNMDNGALKVIPQSHLKGIYKAETIDWNVETETICNVQKGGTMFMKPLLLHASSRTTNNQKRRVIHIELSRSQLADNLSWAELMYTNLNP